MNNYYNNLLKKFSLEKNVKKIVLDKIILHSGVAKKNSDKKYLKYVFDSINYISDQKPIYSKTKKSISNFKCKKGDISGIFVTLRKLKMWNFYHKLISIIIPNIKEFKGYNKNKIDRFGNLNFGIKDCTIIPDFFNDIKFGININIVVRNLNFYFLDFYKAINFPIN